MVKKFKKEVLESLCDEIPTSPKCLEESGPIKLIKYSKKTIIKTQGLYLDRECWPINEVPRWILYFKNLKHLAIRENKNITEIPKFLADLNNIETLDLRFNNIKSIPVEIIKMPNLKQIELAGNKITYISEEIGDYLMNHNIEFQFGNNPFKTIEIDEYGSFHVQEHQYFKALYYINDKHVLAVDSDKWPEEKIILKTEFEKIYNGKLQETLDTIWKQY